MLFHVILLHCFALHYVLYTACLMVFFFSRYLTFQRASHCCRSFTPSRKPIWCYETGQQRWMEIWADSSSPAQWIPRSKCWSEMATVCTAGFGTFPFPNNYSCFFLGGGTLFWPTAKCHRATLLLRTWQGKCQAESPSWNKTCKPIICFWESKTFKHNMLYDSMMLY